MRYRTGGEEGQDDKPTDQEGDQEANSQAGDVKIAPSRRGWSRDLHIDSIRSHK